jgi:glycosyltransferase involved in cell wall biosynthesis
LLNPPLDGPASPGAERVKLSIVIPAYNEENTVGRAVAEVLNTDYPCDIELIVVDDGSTDATATLLSAFRDDRIVVHRHPVNQGKGVALRSAASMVRIDEGRRAQVRVSAARWRTLSNPWATLFTL